MALSSASKTFPVWRSQGSGRLPTIAVDLVTDAPDGPNQRMTRTGIQFAAQVVDIHVYDVRHSAEIEFPDLFDNRRARHPLRCKVCVTRSRARSATVSTAFAGRFPRRSTARMRADNSAKTKGLAR